jgi:hypothetical protein
MKFYSNLYNLYFNKSSKTIYRLFLISLILLLVVFIIYKAYKKLTQKKIYVCCLYSKTGVLGSAPYDNYDILVNFFKHGLKKYDLNVNIIPLYKDLGDDLENFSKWVEECVQKYDVKYCFGCWRSSERIQVLPILTKYNLRLFYPLQYEGMEAANSIYYFGSTPNQQIFPGLEYMFKHFYYYNDFYIVGSDYIYPQVVIKLVKNFLKVHYPNNRLIYTKLYPLDAIDFSEFIDTVFKKSPKGAIILNLINGKSYYDYSKQFYEKYYLVNPQASKYFVESSKVAEKVFNELGKDDEIISIFRRYPTISTSIFENDVHPDYIKYIKESFAASNFASQVLDEEIYFPNKGYKYSEYDYKFFKKYQKQQNKPIGDSQYNSFISAYFFMKILKKVIDDNKDIYNVEDFDNKAKATTLFGICGPHDMAINAHITKLFYILKIFENNYDNRYKIVYDSYNILSPAPYLYAGDKITYDNSFDATVNILNRMYS